MEFTQDPVDYIILHYLQLLFVYAVSPLAPLKLSFIDLRKLSELFLLF